MKKILSNVTEIIFLIVMSMGCSHNNTKNAIDLEKLNKEVAYRYKKKFLIKSLYRKFLDLNNDNKIQIGKNDIYKELNTIYNSLNEFINCKKVRFDINFSDFTLIFTIDLNKNDNYVKCYKKNDKDAINMDTGLKSEYKYLNNFELYKFKKLN